MQAVFTNHWKADTNVNAIQPGYDLFVKMVFHNLLGSNVVFIKPGNL